MFKIGDKLTSENYMQGASWCNKNNAVIIQEGDEYIIAAIPEYIPTYQELRAADYPSIAEQLDMLYWDKVNGTNIWQETIAAVKEKHPKPVEVVEAVSEIENTTEEID